MLLPPPFELRPAAPEDEAFLFALYASTRQAELDAWGWDAHQAAAFLRLQFTAQRSHYQGCWPNAEHQVITKDGQAVGRLLVDYSPTEILLLDIALLPEHRGQGLGGALIAALQAQSARLNTPVCLHVLRDNPAQRLYHRLGFLPVGGDRMYLSMEWRPAPQV